MGGLCWEVGWEQASHGKDCSGGRGTAVVLVGEERSMGQAMLPKAQERVGASSAASARDGESTYHDSVGTCVVLRDGVCASCTLWSTGWRRRQREVDDLRHLAITFYI